MRVKVGTMAKGFRDICFVAGSFIVSRLFVAFGVFLGRKFFLFAPAFRGDVLETVWWKSLVRWDANHYLNIATRGYDFLPDGKTHNIGFFPLYPLLIRFFSDLLSISPVAVGLLLSNVSFLIALLLLHRYTKQYHHDADPDLAVLIVAFHPFGVFFSSIYNESLFLLLCVFAFSMFRSGRMIASAGALSLMGTTRLAGLFALASIGLSRLFGCVVHSGANKTTPNSRELLKLVSWGVFSLAGFLAFVAYQHYAFGYWDAFIRVHAAFERHPIGSFSALVREMRLDPYSMMNILSAAAVLALGSAFLFLKDYRLYSVWGILTVLVPISTGTFASLTRYAMVFFPMAIFGSALLKKTPFLRDVTIMACSPALIFLSALFARSYFLG